MKYMQFLFVILVVVKRSKREVFSRAKPLIINSIAIFKECN